MKMVMRGSVGFFLSPKLTSPCVFYNFPLTAVGVMYKVADPETVSAPQFVSLYVAGKLVEELTGLLCARKQLTRAALHLLLVPQIRGLSLDMCPGLITPVVCSHITARCQVRFKKIKNSPHLFWS